MCNTGCVTLEDANDVGRFFESFTDCGEHVGIRSAVDVDDSPDQ